MNNLLAQNSTCFHANALIYLYYGKGANHLTRDFFVRQFKVLEGYILICREGFRLYNEKGANLLTRDFFVRQFKVLEGYILICREGFRLYNGKRSVKSLQISAVE